MSITLAESPSPRSFTPDEYLARERVAVVKSEYVGGKILPMAGVSPIHVRIASNFGRLLGNALEERPCNVYQYDLRVRIPSLNVYSYPDVIVTCGEERYEDDNLLNPLLLVEVLSESTEAYDRGLKFIQYRSIDSLQDYILVSQTAPIVDHFARQPDDRWLLTTVVGLDKSLTIPSLGCTLPLSGIYRNVVFPQLHLPF